MTPIDRLKDLLSDDILILFSVPILDRAFEDSFIYVSDLITAANTLDSLLTNPNAIESEYYTTTQTDWEVDNFLENRKILYVYRKISDLTVYYKCRRLNTEKVHSSLNEGSIFYDNNAYLPTYYTGNDGALTILPLEELATPAGKVYYLTYPKFGETHDTHDLITAHFSTSNDEDTIFKGLPREARELVYLQMSLVLLKGYLANYVFEDEDEELIGLLEQLAQGLLVSQKEQLTRVVANYGSSKGITKRKGK